MRTYSEMMQLHNDGKLAVLTEDVAKTLIGKKISTLYFGYSGQDGVDTFVVGQIMPEIEYVRNKKEECYPDSKGNQNRAEYWESYMTPAQLLDKQRNIIITEEGRYTYIFAFDGVFCCSDSDRWVHYIVEE